MPVITNATSIGRGADAGKRALTFRDNAGGTYTNSIFYNWAKGVDIEDCLLYTSPSPRDTLLSRMPSSA